MKIGLKGDLETSRGTENIQCALYFSCMFFCCSMSSIRSRVRNRLKFVFSDICLRKAQKYTFDQCSYFQSNSCQIFQQQFSILKLRSNKFHEVLGVFTAREEQKYRRDRGRVSLSHFVDH